MADMGLLFAGCRNSGELSAALDNGQRSTRKQLVAVVRRILYALRWSRRASSS
jgi:hypothetical protein